MAVQVCRGRRGQALDDSDGTPYPASTIWRWWLPQAAEAFVFRWPSRSAVVAAAKRWMTAMELHTQRPPSGDGGYEERSEHVDGIDVD
jgi:hypothetical protein